MASLTTVLVDIQANDVAFSDTTMYGYVNALRRIFLIEDIPAWKPSLRSKAAIRTSEKRQFVDPSIATAVLRANADSILDDFNYFGFLFESLVARDLRVYAQALILLCLSIARTSSALRSVCAKLALFFHEKRTMIIVPYPYNTQSIPVS